MNASGRLAALGLIICTGIWLPCHSVQGQAGAMRTWTNAQGRTLQGAYLRLSGSDVEISLADGKVVKVPLSSLSKGDQDHVASLQPKPEPPAKIPADVELKEIPVPEGDALGVFAVDVGDFTVSFNDAKAKSLSTQALRELIQPLQAAAWTLRDLRCGCEPAKGLRKPQARFLTRDVMQVSESQAALGYCRIAKPSFAVEVAWNEVSSPADANQGTALVPVAENTGIMPSKPELIPSIAMPTRVGASEEERKLAEKESRMINLLAGGVHMMLREDALFLPAWVPAALVDMVQLLPREQGWPQVARFKSAFHAYLTRYHARTKSNPTGSLAAEMLASGDGMGLLPERKEAGALLLAAYFLQFDYGSGAIWRGAITDARADSEKLRTMFAAIQAHRVEMSAYLKSRGITPGADGSFTYNSLDPPPPRPEDPFPEAQDKGIDVLRTRHSAKFAGAFGKQDVAKSVEEVFAKQGLPLGDAFKPDQPAPPTVANETPPKGSIPTSPPVAIAPPPPSGAIISTAKRVPVDNRTWPLQIKVGITSVDPAGSNGRYRCGRFEFTSDVPLPPAVVREVSRTFTAVEELVQQLPWGITPTPAKSTHFQARLFSTRQLYERDGGPALSGGVYDLKDKIFRVPFESLGLQLKGGEVIKQKGFNLDTVIHELTHMMMDEMLQALPIWVVEGSAEYTEMIPFTDGLFRFGDHAEGMKAYVKEFVEKNAMPTADDCVKVLRLTTPQWHNAIRVASLDPNAPPPSRPGGIFVVVPGGPRPPPDPRVEMQGRLYCAATLLYYYFMHLDEPRRGRPMLPFLDAVQDDLPQWRQYMAAVPDYRAQMDAFLKQPRVQSFPDGRFSYPSNLTPPQPPALPGGAKDAALATQVHLDILIKGRSDEVLRDLLRQKYATLGITLR